MLALERTSYRLFPLPPIYNFRRFTLTSLYNINGPARPVVTRTTIFSQISKSVREGTLSAEAADLLQKNYVQTATRAALQMVTNHVQMMKDAVSNPAYFLLFSVKYFISDTFN